MASLLVICDLPPPNQKSWLRLWTNQLVKTQEKFANRFHLHVMLFPRDKSGASITWHKLTLIFNGPLEL